MCVSRFYKVVARDSSNFVEVEDALGSRSYASLLSFEGPAPHVGDWVVVHSGYVLERADADEARAIVEEIRAAIGSLDTSASERVEPKEDQ